MIEFIGKFDEKVSQNLNKHTMRKMWWLYLIASVVFILGGILGVVYPEDSSDLIMGIVLIAFGVLFTPLSWLLTYFIQHKMNKTMPVMSPDTVQTYQFYPDKIIITQQNGDNYNATTTTDYSSLYKVEETADCYFLYISKVQSHVVNKADLTQGTIEELNVILHASLGNKFKSLK